MNKRLVSGLAATVLTLTFAAGCGGGRPSEADVRDGIKENMSSELEGIPEADQAIDCIAKVFHDSDLSDEALQAVVDGDEDYEGSEKDNTIMDTVVADDMSKCIADAMK